MMLAASSSAHPHKREEESTDIVPGLPYVLRIEHPRDLLRFERDLRALLECESPMCTFLHCAEYAAVKFDVRHALASQQQPSGIPPPASTTSARTLRIPNSTLMMHVSDDSLTFVVQLDPNLILYPEFQSAAGKTKRPDNQHQNTLMESDADDAPQRKRGRALCGDAPRALVVSAPAKAPRKPRRGAVGKGVEEKEAAFVAGRVTTLKARREEKKA